MADALFINEEFYKKNVSHKQSYDSAQIISSIRLVQKTNLVSIITQSIYDSLQEKIANSTAFTVGEEKLLDSIQLFLAVKTAEELIYAAPEEIRDGSGISYKQKSNLMEARIVRDINRDADLLALAQSDSVEFDDAELDNAGGFYFT